MATLNEEIIGSNTTPEGTLEYGETDASGQRFETFTPTISSETLSPSPAVDFQQPEPETIYPVGSLAPEYVNLNSKLPLADEKSVSCCKMLLLQEYLIVVPDNI